MPDSEPLSPQQRPPHPRLRPWRDAAAVGGLLLAVNALAAPHDPGWFLLNPSPWLLLPGLIGMRHGFRWGFLIGSAASLAVLGMLSVFQPGLPGVNLVYFLSLPAAGLLSGAAHRLENGPVNDPGTGRESEDDTAGDGPAPASLPVSERATEPAPPAPDSAVVLLRSQLEESAGIHRELTSRLEEKGNEILGLNRQCEDFSRQCGDLSRQQEALRQERDALSAELARRADDPRALEEKQAPFLRQQRREEEDAAAKTMASQTDADADAAPVAAAMEETRLSLQRETLHAAVGRRDAVRAYVERRREARDRLAEQEARHGREVQALHSERDALTSRLDQASRRLAERGDELEVMVSCQDETQAMLAAREHALGELAGRLETLDAVVADRDRMIQSLRLKLEHRMAIPQAVEPEAKQEEAESEPAHTVSLLWSEAHDTLRTEACSQAGVPGETIVASMPLGAGAGEEISTSEPPQAPATSSEFKTPESHDQERQERQVQIQTLERELAGCREMMDQLTAQRDELAARLEERLSLLEILTEERAALTDKLAESGEALRKVEAARDILGAHADHRNGLLKPVTARSLPQARRLSHQNGGLRHQDSPESETEDGPDGIPPRLVVEGGRDFPAGMAMTAAQDTEEAPLEPQFRSLFLAGAGPVFPHLLMLLEETAGVTDAAFYQIDGTRLERSALRGEGGMLPGAMPLATAEIAALAVARQSLVTCRQVWATVPVQDSPWLAALPWPSDGFHCTSLLLIHRMQAGKVSRRTFSRIQLICRWVARFMELHGLKGGTSEPAGGALTVRPEVMRRALLDAAAAYREQGLCSSTLTLRLNGESHAHQEQLVKTALAHLRPTDLICQERAAPVTAGDPSSASSSIDAAVTMEILLTFSDPVEAEEIAGPLAHAIDGDPALCGTVTLSPPSLVGGDTISI